MPPKSKHGLGIAPHGVTPHRQELGQEELGWVLGRAQNPPPPLLVEQTLAERAASIAGHLTAEHNGGQAPAAATPGDIKMLLEAPLALPTRRLQGCAAVAVVAVSLQPTMSCQPPLTALKVEGLPDHLEPWRAGGFKAWDLGA